MENLSDSSSLDLLPLMHWQQMPQDLMATELRWEYSGSLDNGTVRGGHHRI